VLLIGLDVDGVLYRWGKAARAVMVERFGVEVSEEEWFGEDHCTPQQWAWMWSDEGVDRVFSEGRAFPGAIAFVRNLETLGQVHLLTAVPPNGEAARRRWFRRRGLDHLPLHVVKLPRKLDGVMPAKKSDVVLLKNKPQADVYIDDNPGNCVELARNTDALVILVDHSWNRGPEIDAMIAPYPRIVRVRGFRRILDIVGKLNAAGSNRYRSA